MRRITEGVVRREIAPNSVLRFATVFVAKGEAATATATVTVTATATAAAVASAQTVFRGRAGSGLHDRKINSVYSPSLNFSSKYTSAVAAAKARSTMNAQRDRIFGRR